MLAPAPPPPLSVGDSRSFYQAAAASSMLDVMGACQAGYIDYGFLGAAMIDMYGNINTTVIGDWELPKVRLPGSGGANDIGSLCPRTIVIMRQDERKFVERVSFVTTPGYLDGPGARERAGLPADTGPYRVITQLAVYDFDEQDEAPPARVPSPRGHGRGRSGEQRLRNPRPGRRTRHRAAGHRGAATATRDRPGRHRNRQVGLDADRGLRGPAQRPARGAQTYGLQNSFGLTSGTPAGAPT